jgi:acyl carrier protein
MHTLDSIKDKVTSVVLDVLQVEDGAVQELQAETPFFGTEEEPGIIQDSLAILEIASKLAEEYGIMPSDFNEASFQNVETLSTMIFEKLAEQQAAEQPELAQADAPALALGEEAELVLEEEAELV